MANSIANLAVQITTDTSGMEQGFQRARYATEDFNIHTQKLNGGLTRLGSIALRSSGALGSFGRVAVAGGNLAGPVGLAGVAFGALAIGLARASAASEDFRIEKFREFGLAAPGVKTLADLMGELREQFGAFAELSGISLKPLIEQATQLARAFSTLLFGEAAVRNLERQNAEAKGLAEKMKLIKEQEEARFKLADEMSKKSIDILKRGEQITKSLRTPDELFRDTITELKWLADVGAITADTLSRGINKAATEYENTIGKVKELKNELKPIAALEAGSAAFRSAVFAARQQSGPSAEQLRVEREQLAIQKRIAAATEAALGQPQVTLVRGNL